MREKSRAAVIGLLAACIALVGAVPTQAAAVKQRNVVDLISLSETIAVGTIVRVDDGFATNGVPFTEVTMKVTDPIKGTQSGEYSFRQYGLLAARETGNGLTNLNVRLEGWPTFSAGEKVMVFLYKAAEITGLRTTVGLFQGKFSLVDNKIANAIDNTNLFKNVKIRSNTLNKSEAKLLVHESGTMPANEFISLVRRAVRERWIEEGRMSHELQ